MPATFAAEIRGLLDADAETSLEVVELHARDLSDDYLRTIRLPVPPPPEVWVVAVETSFGRRAAIMCDEVIGSINARRVTTSALALRAYMELCGALVHCTRRVLDLVSPVIEGEASRQLHQTLERALSGSRFDWDRFLREPSSLRDAYAKASDDAGEPAPELQQVNVSTFIGGLEKYVRKSNPRFAGVIRMARALLSDICHPASGGDFTAHLRDARPGEWIEYGAAPSDRVLRNYLGGVVLPVLAELAPHFLEATNSLRALAGRIKSGEIVVRPYDEVGTNT